jgi:hypothetical protein
MKKFVVCTLILVLFNLSNLVLSHFCGLSFLKRPKRILVSQENENRRHLKEETWEPLRIHLDFSMIENNLDKFNKKDLLDLKEKIMPKTKQVLEKLLKVKRLNRLKLPNGNCEEIKVPEHYSNDGVDADIVIFVVIDQSGFFLQNHIEAAAIHCIQHDLTRRPIAGYIQFKPDLKVDNKTAEDYMVWLALHEITHILVMNDSLYEDWVDANLQPLGWKNVVGSKILPSGRKMSYLKTPKILEKGKEHFGCSNFEGLPLEYNGGPGTAGAHWSKRIMNTDYMIGDSYGENLISDLTLAMFEDSGWYQTDYKLANLFLWGKKQGCDFLDQNIKCVQEQTSKTVTTQFKQNFCTNLDFPTCSTSHIFRANCRTRLYKNLFKYERYFINAKLGGIDLLTDKCPIPIEIKQGQSYYGGSCRVGQAKNINNFERVCPECACFLSNLKEITKFNKKLRKEQENLDSEYKSDTLQEQHDIDENEYSLKFRSEIENTSGEKNIETSQTSSQTVKVEQNNSTLSSNTTNNTSNDSNSNVNYKTAFNDDSEIFYSSQKQNKLKPPPLPTLKESDYRSYCFEYACEEGELYVKVKDRKLRCPENQNINVEGFQGTIQCPPEEVLCHKKYRCKFGCTEEYHNK